MANSTQRGRKLSRSGVAATSAVSLALGAFSVVGPGPLASAQASLTGGIRGTDGSEVINTGDQLESDLGSDQLEFDLGAGSCIVQSAPGSEDGSQAGFSWGRVEPSNNTTDKRTWGVSVAFDNSKDRTFAYWEWSSSSSNRAPVTFGFVPAATAGESLGPDITASDQANEVLGIYRGSQITYGLPSILTEDEVKKFAQAEADSPVRYVWKTQYTKDNDSDKNLQATTNSSFIALVNPWPSENNECNPIKVNWEGIQEHVIVPGEETKVGHINVPALSDGSVDDSLSRMVVEAYDGNGKYIGSSDTNASNGGKKLLRVDDKGDIYYTWPEYRGTDLAADKNVQFSVVAKPRTKGELQTANASNPFYGPDAQVFDSSNSLPRYSKANEIGRNTISLDDTEFHDPQYNTDEQTITSGIDKDGNLTDQPQEVVFEQVPDLIRDLVKEKGNDGFEAKVVLDQRYVFAGWKAEMDPVTYDVTVTAPANAEPGTFAQPRVIVEYSNGSKDELSLLVIVDPNHTQITDLVRPAVAKGEVNKAITSQITTKSIMNGYDPVAPATFEVDQSTVPAGWTVTVDNTGKVTATADDTVAPGTIITPKVKATYPDGTIDEVEPQFQAIVDIKIPDYDTVTNKPGTNVTLTPKVPEFGLTGNASDEAPTRYTFENGDTETTVKDKAGTWTIRIDETTGEITTTIPRTAPEGHILDIPVLAHYSPQSQNKPQKVKGTVVVLKGDIAPVYSVESTGPNQAVDHQVQDAPEGSTFSFGKQPDGSPLTEMTTEDGWKYTINPETGVVTSTPPAGSKPGDKKTITVDVLTPTGATPKVPVTTVVQLTNSWEAEPSYPAETVYPGDTATLPVTLDKPDNVNVAADNPYELGAVPPGWTVSIDNEGKITATAPADAEPGSKVEIPVTVTYEDGSKDTATAVVNVVDVPTRPVPFAVEYVYDDTIPAGEYKTVTKGVAGEEKQNRDGKWEQTTAPTNEVVHVGTKPAEASKDVTWTAPIPYSTTTRPNPALAPGETKVVLQGVNGERTYTAKFTATGDQASVVESEDTKQPVEEIIEYGPRLDDQELVTETTRKIPFETTIVYDNTLEAGTQKVDTQGVVGEEKVTSTQKLVAGKPSGDPVVETTTVTEKQDAVIRVGTKTEGQTVNTYDAAIPFPVRVVYDPNLAPGESKVTQEGKPGTKKVTITQPVVNSAPNGEATVAEETVTEPTEQIVTVGTKPDQATNTATWTAQVPYNTVVRPNQNLKPGEVKTVQQGEYGEKTFTADFSSVGSDSKVDTKEEQTKTPKDQIIEYGPTIVDQTLTSTTTRPIEFETEFILDDTLAAGEQKVEQQGENGEEKITSTQEIKDGKPVGEPTITTEVTKPAKKAIIRVGTKPTTTTATTTATATTTEKSTATETTRVNVPTTITTTLTTTEKTTTTVEGKPTTLTTTKEVPTTITTAVPTTVTTTTTPPALTTVQTSTTTTTVTPEPKPAQGTVDLPFTTKIVFDNTLEPGQRVVDVEGRNGQATVTLENGTGKVTITKEPVQEVVRVGSRPAEGVDWTEELAFQVEVIEDPELEAGQYETITQGKPGQLIHKADGTEERTEPVNHQIKVGTKQPDAVFEDVELPFTTKIVYDPTLEPGQEVEDVAGKNGKVRVTVKDGKATTQTLEQPVQRVVRVGTKPADGVSWTEETPYDVKVEEDPNLEAGKYEVKQEGVPGTKVHNADGSVTETPARDHIIKVGTKNADSVTHSTVVDTPFPVQVVYDPTLKPGESKVTQQGKPGQKKVTISQSLVDGKPSGVVSVTEDVLKDPVPQIVSVGTKPEEAANSAKWVAPLPFDTIVVPNTDLKPGEIRIAQKGEFGEKEFVADFTAVGSSSTVNTTEKVTKQPKSQIIEYGPTISDQTLTSVEHRMIAFPTRFVFDDTLDAGTQEVDSEGRVGIDKITSTQEIKGGKPVGNPTITTDQILAPQERVVRIGTKKVTTTATTTAHATTERVTETATTTVTVPKIVETTTVTEPTTVTQAETTVTKEVPTTVTTQVPSPVIVTTTLQGTPTTYTTTETVPTTITTSVAQVTVTNNVTTTEKSTATETTTVTTTLSPEKPEVHVQGSKIEFWQLKGEPIAMKLSDDNVDVKSLKFRLPDGVEPEKLTNGGRTLELPQGTYTIVDDTVKFAPNPDFTGDIPPVEIEYTRTDGVKVVKPITVIGHYNDCGCKTPKPSTPESSKPESSKPESSTPESSTPQTSVKQSSEPSPTTTNPAEPSSPQSSSNPEPSQPSNPVNPSRPGESSTPKSPTSSAPTSESKPSATVTTTVDGKVTTTVVPATTVVTTVNGTPTTITTPVVPAATTTGAKPTGGLSTVATPTTIPTDTPDAAEVVERCVQNAVRSPLLYLIPLGLLGYGLNEVAGPVIQQATAPYQDALNRINGELNARANEIARQYAPEDPFGVGRAGEELNRRLWENQEFARIANQVNDINAQAARLAAQYQPQLETLGKAAGAIIAVTAAGAVLYDWCSNDAGQAWTAVGTDKWSNLRNQQQ